MSDPQSDGDEEEQRINRLFGSYLYIFPSLLIGLGLSRTLLTAIRSNKLGLAVDPESRNAPVRRVYPPSALSNGFRRWIMYPALFGGRHSQPIGWYTFPTRMETVLVASYWFINIAFLVVYHGDADRNIDATKLIADRAGVLSLWNMPIFFLLAGRNDFLVWLTGWSYGTFHVFHKWVARVSALMAMVHSVSYAVYMYQIGDEARRWNPAYWWNGVSAMIVMGMILVLSIFPFRKKAYEFFLITHILGVIMFIIFLYHHLKLSATRMYNPWIWACIAMWAFDRFSRFLRIFILNSGTLSKDPKNHHLARAKFVKGTDVIQLTVYPSAEDIGYFPGAHYFVFLTGTWRFWESHPFTAAAWRPSGPALTAIPHNGPRVKRSLSGSLKDSLREPKLPPRVKIVDSKPKDIAHLRQMATLKELGAFTDFKELTAAKGKKQERNIYIVKHSGKDKNIFIVTDAAKAREPQDEAAPGVPERKASVKRANKEKETTKSKDLQRSKQGSKKKKKGSRGSEKKEGSRKNSDTSSDRSGEKGGSRKNSDTGSDRSEEKDSESEKSSGSEKRSEKLSGSEKSGENEKSSESEKFSESETSKARNEDSEKVGGPEDDSGEEKGEDEDEDEDDEEAEEFESEKEKQLSKVMVEEQYDEDEDDFPVGITQGIASTIASTARKGSQRPKLTFFIKPRKGMTANLANRIREHEKQNEIHGFPRGRELEIKCLIEGAYGVNHPLHLYETVVLIAGGVGITTILPYLCDYMERARGPERKTLTRRLVFLWTAKEEELVENLVAKRFPRGCLTRRDISMQLYITRNKDGQKKLPGVKYRRPNIGDILKSEQERLVGKMSILSCGPSVLVDIVRSAVVDCLDTERKHIEYFEESY